jgi:hypothetical protein
MSEEARYHVMILLDGLMAERDRWQQALARVQTVEAEDICYRHLKILTHIIHDTVHMFDFLAKEVAE